MYHTSSTRMYVGPTGGPKAASAPMIMHVDQEAAKAAWLAKQDVPTWGPKAAASPAHAPVRAARRMGATSDSRVAIAQGNEHDGRACSFDDAQHERVGVIFRVYFG